MENGKADYWAFIEKIHDLTEYVQELLRQNGRLNRRVKELERQQEDCGEQLASPSTGVESVESRCAKAAGRVSSARP